MSQSDRVLRAVEVAINRVIDKGADDVFRPPAYSLPIENEIISACPDDFKAEARKRALKFLSVCNLSVDNIGNVRRSLVVKGSSSFRQVSWLDPFDAVKYLALAILVFDEIEAERIPKIDQFVHSHRKADEEGVLFDQSFGFDSFRARSSQLSNDYLGKWKIVTDISNFFDRIGNHTLENHLNNVGCEKRYIDLIKEVLLFWAGDRRSYGIPVGSDGSRILSEAVLLTVDRKLREAGCAFVRYVDDFRIFAETRSEAFRSLALLTTLLADEGLSLNGGKTKVLFVEAREEPHRSTNRLHEEEHRKIDLDEKIEEVRRVRVSGHTSISKYFRQPGMDALKKLRQNNTKQGVIQSVNAANEEEIEPEIREAVKFFVYIDQDVTIIKAILEKKPTSIFYLADALCKESQRFSDEKALEVVTALHAAMDWMNCAYPLQVPILRVFATEKFRSPMLARSLIEKHGQADNWFFFREVLSVSYTCLERPQVRLLATEVFPNVHDYIRRVIIRAVKHNPKMTDDEKRPLLRNMKQTGKDWFSEKLF